MRIDRQTNARRRLNSSAEIDRAEIAAHESQANSSTSESTVAVTGPMLTEPVTVALPTRPSAVAFSARLRDSNSKGPAC